MGSFNVTFSSSYMRALSSINKTKKSLETINEALSTGKKIHRPSDSPLEWYRIFSLRNRVVANAQYKKNIEVGRSQLSITENTLAGITNAVNRLKELVLQANSGVLNDQNKVMLVDEIRSLRRQIIEMGNSKFEGKFIFGGFRTDIQPFSMHPEDKNYQAPVTYNGNDGEIKVLISDKSVDAFIERMSLAGNAAPGGLTGVGALNNVLLNGVSLDPTEFTDTLSYNAYGDETKSGIAIANAINAIADQTGVLASVEPTKTVLANEVEAGTLTASQAGGADLAINGVNIVGRIDKVVDLVNLINEKKEQHGVIANAQGNRIVLSAFDGRNITVEGNANGRTIAGFNADSVNRASVKVHAYAHILDAPTASSTAGGISLIAANSPDGDANGILKINGVLILGNATTNAQLVNLIQANFVATGVRAVANQAGDGLTLIDSLGRDILIETDGDGALFSGFPEGVTQYQSTSSTGFVIDEAVPNLALAAVGFADGNTTTVRNLSSTVAINTNGERLFTGTGLRDGVNIFDTVNDIIRGLRDDKTLKLEGQKDFDGAVPFTLNAGDFTINATDITGTFATLDDLITAVNTQLPANSGITASVNHDGKRLALIANKGQDLKITIGSLNAEKVGFYQGDQYHQADQLGLTIENLDKFVDQVIQTRGEIGSRMNSLEATDKNLDFEGDKHIEAISNLEDADMIEAASALAQQQNLFQTILASTAKILQPNLLDFLR